MRNRNRLDVRDKREVILQMSLCATKEQLDYHVDPENIKLIPIGVSATTEKEEKEWKTSNIDSSQHRPRGSLRDTCQVTPKS